MTNAGDALLADILANPEDGPRLVYADWLDEHGEAERAEFIRVQCEEAGLDEDDPRRQALARRSWEIAQSNLIPGPRPEWTGGIHALASEWKFRRGFVEHVALPAATFLERAADLFRRAPVCSVHFTGVTPESLAVLGACPFLGRLTGIDLSWNEVGDQGVATLLHARHLGKLRTLCLKGTGLTSAGVEALAASPQLAGLAVLDLASTGRFVLNQIDTRGAVALAASPHLRQLTSLNLGTPPEYGAGNRIGTAGCLALAGSAILDTVRALDLSSNIIEDAGVQALAHSPHAAELRRLDLRGNTLTAAGIEALIASPVLSRLRVLGLSSNPGGPACEYGYDWDGSCVYESLDQEAADRLARRFSRPVQIT